jgi:hypothetical protein
MILTSIIVTIQADTLSQFDPSTALIFVKSTFEKKQQITNGKRHKGRDKIRAFY